MKHYLLTFLLLIFSLPAMALNLELTQGVHKAIPVAVVPFGGASNQLSQIISQDLTNSGVFNVLASSALPNQPHGIDQIQFGDWRKLPVNDLLVGNVTSLGDNRYRVSFSLLDAFKSQQLLHFNSLSEATVNAQLNPVLSHQTFTVSAQSMRMLAHHISDVMYQKLTGQKGVFESKLAYVLVQRTPTTPTKYTLEVSDYDGHNPQSLLTSSQPIMSPAWSPGGKKIAYVSFENHRTAIYESNLATGQRQRLSNYPGINSAPKYSPNGKQLALALSMGGENPNLYLLTIAGGQLTQLTKDQFINTEPSWSPDGKSLIFTSNRHGGPQVYQMNLADKSLTQLTHEGYYNASASFTPNADSIVFLHRDDRGYAVAEQAVANNTLQQLTVGGLSKSPTVSPDGRMIIYTDQVGSQRGLALVSFNGLVKAHLYSPKGDVQTPSWSPVY